jgi:uncharacterized membrane protein
MHSWHPVMVHVPLVALLLAVAFDLLAAQGRSSRWREAGTALWWVGLLGLAAALTTGLIAYNRVDHSDLAHREMTLHRNVALAAAAILVGVGVWRWKRPYSRGAAVLGLVGALALAGVGYLGGDLVYRHGVGIPNKVLEEIAHERGGHTHGLEPDGPAVHEEMEHRHD